MYNISYHIIWCPKYRRCLHYDEVETRLKELMYEKSSEHGWTVKAMEVMPDHVHLFLSANASDSISTIVAILKGHTSYILRNEFAHLQRLPSLWTRSYYVETIGNISESTIKRYIAEQKTK